MKQPSQSLAISKQDLLNTCKILIVEDDYIGRLVIKELFIKTGFQNIFDAENGKIGLQMAKEIEPHLIIMDIEMPEMDGITCCQEIRKDKNIADAVILVQTALTKTDDKASIFEAGADDYISKPIDPYEITARSILHLERSMMMQKLKSYHERMQSELDIAQQTQNILMPSSHDLAKIGADYKMNIKSHFETSSELGGDFWGIRSLSTQKLAIYLIDFCGHGVHAALNTFRLHALMQNNLGIADRPGAYVTHLNALLAPLLPADQFATMFYGVIDVEKNRLSFASAAAPYPILFRNHCENAEPLCINNLPLGVNESKTYTSKDVPFHSGDMLFLYSDALTETPDQNDEHIDIDTASYLIQEYFGTGPSFNIDQGFTKFLESFQKRSPHGVSDDLTLNMYFRT